jgi:hypothetical protein
LDARVLGLEEGAKPLDGVREHARPLALLAARSTRTRPSFARVGRAAHSPW